jgi:hypothetical protein
MVLINLHSNDLVTTNVYYTKQEILIRVSNNNNAEHNIKYSLGSAKKY